MSVTRAGTLWFTPFTLEIQRVGLRAFFSEWFPKLFSTEEHKEWQDCGADEHYLGQPLQIPGGRVSFPVSGWLTRSLDVWPLYPRDIRPLSTLNPRDVGSRAWAQFKQAATVSLTVFSCDCDAFFGRSRGHNANFSGCSPCKPIIPQPALSLCSAEHEKFMEEFRCQIRRFASNYDTDRPFCGDKSSSDSVLPLTQDFEDLQGVYCGI